MFFVRKAAEPIGGDDAPLPGSAAVNAAGPSGRARCRHNRAPLLDAAVIGTTSALPKPISVVAARRQHVP